MRSKLILTAAAVLALLGVGCRQDMHDQPKLEALERNNFFADKRASRPLIEGVVARGHLQENKLFYSAKEGDKLIDRLPEPLKLDKALLVRGQQRYNIYCTPCHDARGTGNGMIVKRGMRRPPSYHSDRMRAMPLGHFYDVITNGFGAMQDYSAQIAPEDRWAIAAYVRVLQVSENANVKDLPANAASQLPAKPAPGSTPAPAAAPAPGEQPARQVGEAPGGAKK